MAKKVNRLEKEEVLMKKEVLVKEKVSEKKVRTATVKELYQDCPKCNGDLLVRVQSKKGLEYLCQECGHSEFRVWK